MKRLSFFLALLFFSGLLFAHSGRTDRYGGHHNRKTGGYHYHNAGYVHAADNPYQNHKTCGICTKTTSKSAKTYSPKTEVFFVQSSLKLLGYYHGKIDGISGPNTRSSIKNFQKNSGVYPSGFMNKETQKLLLVKLDGVNVGN